MVSTLTAGQFAVHDTLVSNLVEGDDLQSCAIIRSGVDLIASDEGYEFEQGSELNALVLRQMFTVTSKHYLTKVVLAIMKECNAFLAVQNNETDAFGKLVSKCIRVVLINRGLIPRVVRQLCIEYAEQFAGKHKKPRGVHNMHHEAVAVVIFHQFIIPALIAPQELGIAGMPWD